jgi:hypothetical protein
VNRLATYFWPYGGYRDANHGSLLERAAARRHNRELSHGLPAYINRWAMVTAVLLMLIQVVPVSLAPLVGVLFTVSLCGVVHLVHVWTLFKRLS